MAEMYAEMTTTITHRIEIGDEGIGNVTHSVEIDAGQFGSAFPQDAIYAVVEGGCKSVLRTLTEEES